MRNPSEPTFHNGYPIYPSRGRPNNVFDLTGDAVLVDFGSARFLDTKNEDWWMPDTYRAPEVLMSLPWSEGVDLWSIGILVGESVVIVSQIPS